MQGLVLLLTKRTGDKKWLKLMFSNQPGPPLITDYCLTFKQSRAKAHFYKTNIKHLFLGILVILQCYIWYFQQVILVYFHSNVDLLLPVAECSHSSPHYSSSSLKQKTFLKHFGKNDDNNININNNKENSLSSCFVCLCRSFWGIELRLQVLEYLNVCKTVCS